MSNIVVLVGSMRKDCTGIWEYPSFFAELKKSSARQRERLEKAMEELLEKIRGVDWIP